MKKCLTLVELLVVIGIIIIVFVLVAPPLAKTYHTGNVKLLTEKIKTGQTLSFDEQRQLTSSFNVINNIGTEDNKTQVKTAMTGLRLNSTGNWVRDTTPLTAEAPVAPPSPVVSPQFFVGSRGAHIITDPETGKRYLSVDNSGTVRLDD